MDSRTGDLYPSVDEAEKAGVPREDIVELLGRKQAIQRVAAEVKAFDFMKAKLKRGAEKKSRRRNRPRG